MGDAEILKAAVLSFLMSRSTTYLEGQGLSKWTCNPYSPYSNASNPHYQPSCYVQLTAQLDY